MSSPVIAGMWYTRANAPFPETATAVNINNGFAFMLKELLKGTSTSGTEGPVTRPAGTNWTVEGSCDSLTGAMDGVDRLTGTVANSFDATKWVHAASGTAHSWIVLKSPAALGPVWMCIDANSATTTTYGVVFSRQQFTGSVPGGATSTQLTQSRPITNFGWIAGATTDPIPTTAAVMMTDQNAGGMYRAHISVDASGAFNYLVSRDGTGFFSTILSCFNTVDRNANDNAYPTFTMFHSVAGSRGAPAWSTVGVTSANCSGRTVDGTATQSAGGFSSWAFGATQFASNATPDVGFTTSRVLPMYIQTLVANKNSWRGRCPDLWVVGMPTVGASFPNSTNPTHHVAGDIIVPLSVVPIL